VIYRDGEGNVPRDLALAKKWLEVGAEGGQHYSMYDLADLTPGTRSARPTTCGR
jgi:TPR repeat protein